MIKKVTNERRCDRKRWIGQLTGLFRLAVLPRWPSTKDRHLLCLFRSVLRLRDRTHFLVFQLQRMTILKSIYYANLPRHGFFHLSIPGIYSITFIVKWSGIVRKLILCNRLFILFLKKNFLPNFKPLKILKRICGLMLLLIHSSHFSVA